MSTDPWKLALDADTRRRKAENLLSREIPLAFFIGMLIGAAISFYVFEDTGGLIVFGSLALVVLGIGVVERLNDRAREGDK